MLALPIFPGDVCDRRLWRRQGSKKEWRQLAFLERDPSREQKSLVVTGQPSVVLAVKKRSCGAF